MCNSPFGGGLLRVATKSDPLAGDAVDRLCRSLDEAANSREFTANSARTSLLAALLIAKGTCQALANNGRRCSRERARGVSCDNSWNVGSTASAQQTGWHLCQFEHSRA
jgi:hypothetical protein